MSVGYFGLRCHFCRAQSTRVEKNLPPKERTKKFSWISPKSSNRMQKRWGHKGFIAVCWNKHAISHRAADSTLRMCVSRSAEQKHGSYVSCIDGLDVANEGTSSEVYLRPPMCNIVSNLGLALTPVLCLPGPGQTAINRLVAHDCMQSTTL